MGDAGLGRMGALLLAGSLALAGCSSGKEPVDELGACFEIFPDSEPEGLAAPSAHDNPTLFEVGEVPVGTSVTMRVGYFNHCEDPDPVVLDAGWVGDGPSDESFEVLEVPEAVDGDDYQSFVRIRFTPQAERSYDATFRLRFSHGYYDIEISAEGVAP